MSKKKSWKKKAAVGAVCAAASTGILVGSTFDSPGDLLPDVDAISITAQADDDGGMVTGDDEDEEKGRKGSPLRRWILGLPLGVRSCVCVPLWCIGTGLLYLLGLLYQAALTPLGSTILSWVLAAAMVLAVFCITAKAMFPDVPLKKLLRPRHFIWLLGGMFLLGVADVVLPHYWADWPTVGKLLRLIGTAVLTGTACLGLWRIGKRLQKKPAPESVPVSDPRTEVEKQAMALADSVCPRPIYKV